MKIQERTGAGNNRSSAPVQPTMGERLPSPPRERKPALAALAVLLILVGALGATMLVLRAGERVEVVKVTGDIQAGESVGDKVKAVLVADDAGINYVKWTQIKTLKKLKAKSTIYAGTLVIGQMFGTEASVPDGKAVVGLSLKEGQYPEGIEVGDLVAAYQVGNNTSANSGDKTDSGSTGSAGSSGSAGGAPIVDDARVTKVPDDSADSTISSTNKRVTVTVDESDAAALARAAAANEVALVKVPGN
ncbi:hypothetical protein C6Y14_34945 [Streptomyces dioscori]|uniref:SAF domain-containing protein n=1 Tax=Streptomyces dioscori TaxID=2109333 RepID=A0A2P8PXQ0_9ACTN|nr:hypothetical protein [Streptomyces dioscori]PSM38777.1 hypothetical protein C6Y14_34945 [Streptomyces dioscori]